MKLSGLPSLVLYPLGLLIVGLKVDRNIVNA